MHSHHRNFEHMKMERRKLNDTLSHPQSHHQNSTINSVTYFHLLFPLSFLQGGPNLSFSWAPQLSEWNTTHLCTDQKSGGGVTPDLVTFSAPQHQYHSCRYQLLNTSSTSLILSLPTALALNSGHMIIQLDYCLSDTSPFFRCQPE